MSRFITSVAGFFVTKGNVRADLACVKWMNSGTKTCDDPWRVFGEQARLSGLLDLRTKLRKKTTKNYVTVLVLLN